MSASLAGGNEAPTLRKSRIVLDGQLTLGCPGSEIDCLHTLELCPKFLERHPVDTSICHPGSAETLLSLWKSLGRPHPVILRGEVLRALHPETDAEKTRLLDWSWRVWSDVKSEAQAGGKP